MSVTLKYSRSTDQQLSTEAVPDVFAPKKNADLEKTVESGDFKRKLWTRPGRLNDNNVNIVTDSSKEL